MPCTCQLRSVVNEARFRRNAKGIFCSSPWPLPYTPQRFRTVSVLYNWRPPDFTKLRNTQGHLRTLRTYTRREDPAEPVGKTHRRTTKDATQWQHDNEADLVKNDSLIESARPGADANESQHGVDVPAEDQPRRPRILLENGIGSLDITGSPNAASMKASDIAARAVTGLHNTRLVKAALAGEEHRPPGLRILLQKDIGSLDITGSKDTRSPPKAGPINYKRDRSMRNFYDTFDGSAVARLDAGGTAEGPEKDERLEVKLADRLRLKERAIRRKHGIAPIPPPQRPPRAERRKLWLEMGNERALERQKQAKPRKLQDPRRDKENDLTEKGQAVNINATRKQLPSKLGYSTDSKRSSPDTEPSEAISAQSRSSAKDHLSSTHESGEENGNKNKSRELWQIQKAALKEKLKDEPWNPRKKLSPDAMEGIRALHKSDPEQFSTPILANQFKVSPDAIRRILKSKWTPSEVETENRRQRWDRRGERIWSKLVEEGVRPPKKWREMGIGKAPSGQVPKWKTRHRYRGQSEGPREALEGAEGVLNNTPVSIANRIL
ncbi:MAG: Required for respiratory growth protein 9 mitochondrial [Bogoriella megaspora]|nr:MAG: Required for respiratory growth protein 9 mitochondrial [Bogoriella megaspora]